MADLPFVYRFDEAETRIYVFVSGLDLRKCPKVRVASFKELWVAYWKLVEETFTTEKPDVKGKDDEAYRKALNRLFESGTHPPVYPIVYNNDTSLLFKALGLATPTESPAPATKKVSFSREDEVKEFDGEEIIEPPKSTKPPPKNSPTKKGSLPKVTLLPFPSRKAWPYALVGETKDLKEYLKFPDLGSNPKPSMYVFNVNKEFGPGWNLKEEAVEEIRSVDGTKLTLIEYQDLDEYRETLE